MKTFLYDQKDKINILSLDRRYLTPENVQKKPTFKPNLLMRAPPLIRSFLKVLISQIK